MRNMNCTRHCTHLCRVACACAGSWSPASWWTPCPGEHWHCGVKAAGEPGRRTPLSLCCAGSELRHETSPYAALSWSCKQKDEDGHTIVLQKYYTHSLQLSHIAQRMHDKSASLSTLLMIKFDYSAHYWSQDITGQIILSLNDVLLFN